MKVKQVAVGDYKVGDPNQFILIAGPCVIESEKSVMDHAEKILKITQEMGVSLIFKASFDKANRSSIKSYRGPGLWEGLKLLGKVKKEFQIPVLSDIHEISQVEPASEVLDILQVPAFLCRQTDLLIKAAKSGKVVNVKKGQFLSPWDVNNIVQKLEEAGTDKIMLTERGVSFGYQNLVSDFRSIPVMRGFGYPVVFDATHSVQLPGGKGDASGGMAEFIPTLSRCAIVAGADALFMEVHENPSAALSDGPNNLELTKLKGLLEVLLELRKVVTKYEEVLA